MQELQELYQQVILDHNKNPRNFGVMPGCSNFAKGHNPLCGDQIDVFAEVENDIIKELKFTGSGCAISKASASIMTTLLVGKTIEEAKGLFEEFHNLITADINEKVELPALGKMAVFCGVREFPARVKCASLAWHTMINALENNSQVAQTDQTK